MKKIILALLLCASLNMFGSELVELFRRYDIRLNDVQTYLDTHPDIDIDVVDRFNSTALMIAILYNKYDIAQLLLGRGAQVNFQNKYGETALMKACDILTAQQLLRSGADVNIGDYLGQTALYFAVLNDSLTLVQLLFDSGASLSPRVRHCKRILSLAISNVNQNMIHFLIANGAEVLNEDRKMLDLYDLLDKQFKPCLKQSGASCTLHAFKNAELLCRYFNSTEEERQSMEESFQSGKYYSDFEKKEPQQDYQEAEVVERKTKLRWIKKITQKLRARL
jgi:uncharacterized protein